MNKISKSTRYILLATTLVSLIASGLVSDTLAKKFDKSFVQTYAMNAPVAGSAIQKCSNNVVGSAGKFNMGTGGYLAANIKQGGGHVDLVDSDLKKKLGVSNLQFRLPAGEALIFDRLSLEYATVSGASGTAVEDVTGWTKNLPEELKNSTLIIKTGDTVVFNGRMNVIHDFQNNADKPYYQLFDPRYLLDDNTWQVTIKMQKSFSGTDDHYVRLNMDGARTTIS